MVHQAGGDAGCWFRFLHARAFQVGSHCGHHPGLIQVFPQPRPCAQFSSAPPACWAVSVLLVTRYPGGLAGSYPGLRCDDSEWQASTDTPSLLNTDLGTLASLGAHSLCEQDLIPLFHQPFCPGHL